MSNLRGRSRKVVTKDLDSESRANFFKSVNLLTRMRDTKMSNLREEFEKLPEIAQALQLIDGFDGYKYYSLNNHRTADWLNGAYYAFQEQQKKIDELNSELEILTAGEDY